MEAEFQVAPYGYKKLLVTIGVPLLLLSILAKQIDCTTKTEDNRANHSAKARSWWNKRDIFNPGNREPMARICYEDQECLEMIHENSSMIAKCTEGFCQLIPSNRTDGGRSRSTGAHMLPIMIIMGIMFVGMCVAMNMFSRARFKNHRSIFSNPRLLKLATANSQNGANRSRRPKFLPRKSSRSSSGRKNKIRAVETNSLNDVAKCVMIDVEQLENGDMMKASTSGPIG